MNPKFHKTMKTISGTLPFNQFWFSETPSIWLTKNSVFSLASLLPLISRNLQDCWHTDVTRPCPCCWGSNLEMPFKEKVWKCNHLSPCCLKMFCHYKYVNTSHTQSSPLASWPTHTSRACLSSGLCLGSAVPSQTCVDTEALQCFSFSAPPQRCRPWQWGAR